MAECVIKTFEDSIFTTNLSSESHWRAMNPILSPLFLLLYSDKIHCRFLNKQALDVHVNGAVSGNEGQLLLGGH